MKKTSIFAGKLANYKKESAAIKLQVHRRIKMKSKEPDGENPRIMIREEEDKVLKVQNGVTMYCVGQLTMISGYHRITAQYYSTVRVATDHSSM